MFANQTIDEPGATPAAGWMAGTTLRIDCSSGDRSETVHADRSRGVRSETLRVSCSGGLLRPFAVGEDGERPVLVQIHDTPPISVAGRNSQ